MTMGSCEEDYKKFLIKENGNLSRKKNKPSQNRDKGVTIEHVRPMFAEKWGDRDCDIRALVLRPEDAWKGEHDWS